MPVEAQGHFRLVCIEVVGSHARNGFHVGGIEVQHSLVEDKAGIDIVQHVMDPRLSQKQQ